MTPLLSVVVPMYDVEPYLGACLASLTEQDLTDLEVVVVDDGSTDGSRGIADQWAGKDSRIRLLTQANAGLSAARNAGVRAARGRYLAFCDSDDVVPKTAYAALVGSLEATGSDIVSGDVRRVDSSGVRPHPGYQDVFAQGRRRTHILRHTALVRDRMVWNKVFRRSFWDANGLTFVLPAYEDAPVMIRAHIAASAVDVLPEVVYLWRIRERGVPSITQRRNEPENVAACMRMVLDTFDVITAHAEALVPPYVDDMCRGDIRDALRKLRLHDADALSHALSRAHAFVTRIPAGLLDRLDAPDRRLITHVIRQEWDDIRQLVEDPVPL